MFQSIFLYFFSLIKSVRNFGSNFITKNAKLLDTAAFPGNHFYTEAADNWWSRKTLQMLNELRVPFMVEGIRKRTDKLEDCSILEVGCGGGILSEPLARHGAKVTGIDFNAAMIEAAKKHAKLDCSLETNLRYEVANLHHFCNENANKFDVVVASEVIEHIDNQEQFLEDCIKCLKPNGLIFICTPNKSRLAKLLVIDVAETIGVIAKGSHKYENFISFENLRKLLEKNKCSVMEVEGMWLSMFTKKFSKIINPRYWMFYHVLAQKSA